MKQIVSILLCLSLFFGITVHPMVYAEENKKVEFETDGIAVNDSSAERTFLDANCMDGEYQSSDDYEKRTSVEVTDYLQKFSASMDGGLAPVYVYEADCDTLMEAHSESFESAVTATDNDTFFAADKSSAARYIRDGLQKHSYTVTVALPLELREEVVEYPEFLFLDTYVFDENGGAYFEHSCASIGANSWISGDYVFYYYIFDYLLTYEQEQTVEEEVGNLLASLDLDGKTDYEKVRSIYDWICANVTYDNANYNGYKNGTLTFEEYKIMFTAYDALINKTAVCQGYATLLCKCLASCNIKSDIVTGNDHAWNIVKLGRYYYFLDATWDSEAKQFGQEYVYFLKGNNLEGHRLDYDHSQYEYMEKYPIPDTDYTDGEPDDNQDICGDSIAWSYVDGVLTLNGTGDMYDYSVVSKPWFDYRNDIKKVILQDGIRYIGKYAFSGLSALEEVYIPESVQKIGEYAFYYSKKINKLNIEDMNQWMQVELERNTNEASSAKIESMEDYRFNNPMFSSDDEDKSDCRLYLNGELVSDVVVNTMTGHYVFRGCSSLKTVRFGNCVTETGKGVFSFCQNLESVEFADNSSLVSLGAYIFSYTSSLTEITFPEHLRGLDLGTGAFGHSGLYDIHFSEGLNSIGDVAFAGCENLTEIEIPDSVQFLGSSFAGCTGLKKVKLPAALQVLPEDIFSGCSSLNEVVLPQTLIKIDHFAFYDCSSLTEIDIPEGVGFIGDYAFYGCTGLTNLTLPSGIEEIGTGLVMNASIKEINIPEKVTSIGDYAFYGTKITGIDIPNGVTSIGNSAFDSTMLRAVILPVGLTTLGDRAFAQCFCLTEIVIPENVLEIGNSCFDSDHSLKKVTIEASSVKMGSKVFCNVQHLCRTCVIFKNDPPIFCETSLQGAHVDIDFISDNPMWADVIKETYGGMDVTWIPGRVKIWEGTCGSRLNWSVQEGVLRITGSGNMDDYSVNTTPWSSVNTEIQSIVIGEGVTSIGQYAFSDTSATTITISDSVQTIGDGAFAYCSNLREIRLSENVRSIGERTFYYCVSLKTITLPEKISEIGAECFTRCFQLEQVDIQNQSGYFKIGSRAFQSCNGLKTFNLPMGLKIVESGTFDDCKGLTDVTIPDGVVSVEKSAFCGCYSLVNITIPNSVTSIGESAFQGCRSLIGVVLPTGLKTVEPYAFYYCKSLIDITIPDGVTSVGECAFTDCKDLTDITIPGSVTSIGAYAFSYCDSLTDITIPAGVTSVREYTFSNCSNLVNITLPTGVTSVGKCAFSYCYSLTDITLPTGVTSIGMGAFRGCRNLTDITIPMGLKIIDLYTFYNCASLTDITIPSSVIAIKKCALSACRNLQYIYLYGGSYADAYFSDLIYQKIYLSHEKGVYHEAVVSTCAAEGSVEYWECRECICKLDAEGKEIESIVIPKDPDNHVGGTELKNAYPATCGDAGYTGDTYCKDCNAKLASGSVIPATGKHSGGTATCIHRAVCEVCKQEYGEVNPDNHVNTEIRNAKAATCGAAGYTGDTYCKDCNAKLAGGSVIPALSEEGWEQHQDGWYYRNADGTLKSGWLRVNGKWYYLDPAKGNRMATGWVKEGNSWYYMNTDGSMATGWTKAGNSWYYMNVSGVMQTGWVQSGGKWYYLNSDGSMATGWTKAGNSWYYMNSSGVMQTGWVQSGGKWYYLNSDGSMATGWVKAGNSWYYMNSSGVMQTGWIKDGGQWYYMNSSGVWVG